MHDIWACYCNWSAKPNFHAVCREKMMADEIYETLFPDPGIRIPFI